MLDSPNTGSNSYKKGVCVVEGSRNTRRKKIAPSSVRREKKKEKLTSITFGSKLGRFGAGILFKVILSSQKAAVYVWRTGFPH